MEVGAWGTRQQLWVLSILHPVQTPLAICTVIPVGTSPERLQHETSENPPMEWLVSQCHLHSPSAIVAPPQAGQGVAPH